jgi:heterodisulfide reductase subunit B
MYEGQQQKVAEKFNTQYKIPVLLYPQLLGLAMGGDPATDLGFDLNTMPLDKVLAKVKE